MTIETVKQLVSGYLLNGVSFVPNDENNSDYQRIQTWILEGGVVAPQFSDEELLAAEQARLVALTKRLRDLANARPYKGAIANEIVDDEVTETEVNFNFSTIATGQTITEPSNILTTVLIAGSYNPSFYISYSCTTVGAEEVPSRKVTIQLTVDIAKSIMTHLANRGNVNIKAANDLEDQIEVALDLETLAEIENEIHETFSE